MPLIIWEEEKITNLQTFQRSFQGPYSHCSRVCVFLLRCNWKHSRLLSSVHWSSPSSSLCLAKGHMVPSSQKREKTIRQINIWLYVTSTLLGFFLRQVFFLHCLSSLLYWPVAISYLQPANKRASMLSSGGEETVQSCLFHGKARSRKTLGVEGGEGKE